MLLSVFAARIVLSIIKESETYFDTRSSKMVKGKRVGIVGAGNVGSTIAYSLAMLGSCHEIILRDNKMEIAKGKALDM
jgi:phosphoglycerate dehydrogenase-like enzyme